MCKFSVILFLIAGKIFAQNLELSEIENLLPKDSIVRATFIQTKEMKSLEKPLVSTGKLLVVRNVGVVWLTETPTPMKKFIPLLEEEMSKSEHAMITPFFTGEFSMLKKRFDIELMKDEISWQLLITPKSTALRRRLKNITLKSKQNNKLQEIIIMSADENSLKIDFVSEIPTAQTLSKDEEKLFEE